jgi:hypothetical protein
MFDSRVRTDRRGCSAATGGNHQGLEWRGLNVEGAEFVARRVTECMSVLKRELLLDAAGIGSATVNIHLCQGLRGAVSTPSS